MRLDREVLELLRNEPELLAIADAILTTQALGPMPLSDVRRMSPDQDIAATNRQ